MPSYQRRLLLLQVFTARPPILPLGLPRPIASPTLEHQGRRKASRSFRCQARARRRTGVRPARSFPPVLCVAITSCPAASCRLCGQGPSFQAPIRQISFGPAPCKSFFLALLKTAFIIILCCTSAYEKDPNQQHQNQYQHSAALPDRFLRSHAINNRQLFLSTTALCGILHPLPRQQRTYT